MKIRKEAIALILFVLYLSSHAQLQGIIPVSLLIFDVAKWASDFWSYVKTGHQITSSLSESFGDTCSKERKYTSVITGKVIRTIPELSTELEEIGKLIKYRSEKLEDIITKLKLDIDISMRMFALVQSMGVIDNLYKELKDSVPVKKSAKFIGQDYCSFAYRQIYGDILSAKVDNMYNIIVPSQELLSSLLTEIFTELETNKEIICDTGHSTLEYLHSIYTSLVLVEIKAYVITAFSHNLLFNFNGTGHQCEYHHQNPDVAIEMAQEKLRNHLKVYNHVFVKQMNKASREFRACDQGNDFIRDETYLELEGAIQVTIEFPKDWYYAVLNRRDSMSCEGMISYGTKAYCDPKYRFCTIPEARNCRGWTHSCHAVPYWIKGCLATQPPRRYEWLRWRDHSNRVKPALPYCPEDRMMDLTEIDSDWNPCHCQCNDNDVDSISTHIFNLQWVESDVSQNMVVTGVRFIVKYRIMQFQIQQGKLDSHFRVQGTEWKPIKDISEEIRATRLKQKLRGKSPGLRRNIDFMLVEQEVNNAISFDTLNVSYPNVLTGVRFKCSDENIAVFGNLEISLKATKFDYITGKLCTDCEPEIVTSKIDHVKQHMYPKANVNKPQFPTKESTSPGEFVRIEASDWLQDSGQTTLPFFDALPLVSNPPVPLGGMGIYMKSKGDFSGLVSLKFISLDYPKYMKESGEDLEKQIDLLSEKINLLRR